MSPGLPPPEDPDPLDEITSESVGRRELDVARHLSEIRRGQREHAAILRDHTQILDAVRGCMERLTSIEEERSRRGTLLRAVLDAVRAGADRFASLVERALEPQVLGALGVIVRWLALSVVATAAIVYGVSLTGWGVTLGTQLGEAVEGLTAPVDTGMRRADPPAPSPGEPRPMP